VGYARGYVDRVGFGAPVPDHFHGVKGHGGFLVGVIEVEHVGVDHENVAKGLGFEMLKGQGWGKVEDEEKVKGENGRDGEVLSSGECR